MSGFLTLLRNIRRAIDESTVHVSWYYCKTCVDCSSAVYYSFTQFTATAKSRHMSDAVTSGRVKDEDHRVLRVQVVSNSGLFVPPVVG